MLGDRIGAPIPDNARILAGLITSARSLHKRAAGLVLNKGDSLSIHRFGNTTARACEFMLNVHDVAASLRAAIVREVYVKVLRRFHTVRPIRSAVDE